MATRATANQLRFAYRLVRYLGGNVNNIYLILAVVAWAKAEGGGTYDPLNLISGNFASIDAAARATASRLLSRPQYRTIVKVVRRTGGGVKVLQTQALDLLHAAAMSGWDEYFYGGRRKTYGPYGGWMWTQYDPTQNSLIKVWASLLGHKVTLPADLFPQPKAAAQSKARNPKTPRQPDRRVPNRARGDFIEPYGSAGFYEARAHGGTVIDV